VEAREYLDTLKVGHGYNIGKNTVPAKDPDPDRIRTGSGFNWVPGYGYKRAIVTQKN
jgi:hypothetical protein